MKGRVLRCSWVVVGCAKHGGRWRRFQRRRSSLNCQWRFLQETGGSGQRTNQRRRSVVAPRAEQRGHSLFGDVDPWRRPAGQSSTVQSSGMAGRWFRARPPVAGSCVLLGRSRERHRDRRRLFEAGGSWAPAVHHGHGAPQQVEEEPPADHLQALYHRTVMLGQRAVRQNLQGLVGAREFPAAALVVEGGRSCGLHAGLSSRGRRTRCTMSW